MGQARNRASFEDRKALAIAKQKAAVPALRRLARSTSRVAGGLAMMFATAVNFGLFQPNQRSAGKWRGR